MKATAHAHQTGPTTKEVETDEMTGVKVSTTAGGTVATEIEMKDEMINATKEEDPEAIQESHEITLRKKMSLDLKGRRLSRRFRMLRRLNKGRKNNSLNMMKIKEAHKIKIQEIIFTAIRLLLCNHWN